MKTTTKILSYFFTFAAGLTAATDPNGAIIDGLLAASFFFLSLHFEALQQEVG